jgi:hypothetical protein
MNVIVVIEWFAAVSYLYWLFHDRWPKSGSGELIS